MNIKIEKEMNESMEGGREGGSHGGTFAEQEFLWDSWPAGVQSKPLASGQLLESWQAAVLQEWAGWAGLYILARDWTTWPVKPGTLPTKVKQTSNFPKHFLLEFKFMFYVLCANKLYALEKTSLSLLLLSYYTSRLDILAIHKS